MTTAEELRQQAGPSFLLRAATELEQLSARVEELESALHKLNSYDAPKEVQELRLKVAELEAVVRCSAKKPLLNEGVEMTTIEKVKEFHARFNVDLEKRRSASFRLMLEELIEFYDAQSNVERLDALLDLQYFLDGTFHAYGFDHIKEAAFEEVHRSNLSKLWPDGSARFREDGKVQKGPNFLPPDLARFVK